MVSDCPVCGERLEEGILSRPDAALDLARYEELILKAASEVSEDEDEVA
jgi:hypothetical protein